MSKLPLLRDILSVRPHPTVVRLEHLSGTEAQWISASYVLTQEVSIHLTALKQTLCQPVGRGVFVIGHYGSGKSHFLAYLTQQLQRGEFIAQPPTVVTLSLLNFRSELSLERIVGAELKLSDEHVDRRDAWAALADRYPSGLLLIIDELSEFLRSKSSPNAFNEDVRFLQFMAEWAAGQRFWIVCAMQEQIEHTGDLEYTLYRKIKDRYSLRLMLSPAHVRDLISDSILLKNADYETVVNKLIADLKPIFSAAALDYSTLARIYPLHPATLALLEEIRDRFSQSRGIVDFVTSILLGNPARELPPFLDQPIGSFVTPDLIVDHFRDLFELQPEFLALAQQFFPFYQRHLAELFTTDTQRLLAWRLLKLLVLVSLSPVRQSLTAEEAAQWLLLTAAKLDPQKNRQIIERVLNQLVEKGRFVTQQAQGYTLNLSDNSAERFDKLLERELAALPNDNVTIMETLAAALPKDGFNPFVLPREQWQPRRVRWHFHERTYGVYFGDDAVTAGPQEVSLCLRLPWGSGARLPTGYTFYPAKLVLNAGLRELAALCRLASTPPGTLTADIAQRVSQRVKDRIALFQGQVRTAYLDGTLINPAGEREPAPRFDASLHLDEWLGRFAELMYKRMYPGFERFAPSYGPLPNDAYRRLMRWLSQHDLADEDADEYVNLAREAYWVPLELLRRKGREYHAPGNIERHELIVLALSLIANEPAPKALYEHFAQPIYGLVSDQVNLLLIFLLIQGEIDILKGKQSYREAYETLPLPIQYDRIVPARALSLDQLKALERLCEGMQIRAPKQWTVLSQRHAVRQLREAGQQLRQRLQPLLLKLTQSGQAEELVAELRRLLQQWSALDKGEHELQSLQHFLFEIGSPQAFLSKLVELRDLPQRIDRLLNDVERYQHLLNHPAVAHYAAPNIAVQVSAAGSPPTLDAPERVEQWLQNAKTIYDAYKQDYRTQHDAWWRAQQSAVDLRWEVPELARSRHIGLGDTLQKLESARQRLTQMSCRGTSNLDFQPQCLCGYDGKHAPAFAQEANRFEELRREVETTLVLFFQQDSVKEKLRNWQDLNLELTTGTLNYLENKAAAPEVRDVTALDQHLAGVELVKTLAVDELTTLVANHTWEPVALVEKISQWLRQSGAKRVRFTQNTPAPMRDNLALWCAEQALRHGVKLPVDLSLREQEAIAAGLRVEWMSSSALQQFDNLGLTKNAEDRILTWLLENNLPLPTNDTRSPLLAAVRELLLPTTIDSVVQLAQVSTRLYLGHHRLCKLDTQRWLQRLTDLANTRLTPLPANLVDYLKPHATAQWCVIDSLGLPLVATVAPALEKLFPQWQVVEQSFALVGAQTTTSHWYEELVAAGHHRKLEKINVVDTLLHERMLPFADMCDLVLAELRAACKPVRARFDPQQSLLIFADHGFRIASDGRAFCHGGDSLLERIVPVWRLQPRSG